MTNQTPVVPPQRTRYLAEISDSVRAYKKRAHEQARLAREIQQLRETARMLHEDDPERSGAKKTVERVAEEREAKQDKRSRKLLDMGRRCRRPTRATSTSSRSATASCAPS